MDFDLWPTRHDSLHYQRPSSPPLPSVPPPSHSSPLLSNPIEPPASHQGLLSLHNYRKSLSHAHSDAVDGQEGKTLRRKNAASNLNQTTTAPSQMGTFYQNPNVYHPFAESSATSSSPPPLSPSYSPSALSEQLPDLVDGYGYPLTPLDGYYENGDKLGSHKLLDTFRDRLGKFPDPGSPDIVELHGHGHSRARSDSVLLKTRRARKPPPTTVVHQGTSFEIINPHESLDFARIVSYIEDVDSRSATVSNHQRDSCLQTIEDSPILEDSWDMPCEYEEERKAHDDLVGDSPHHPMPSISERLDGQDTESCYSPSVRPLSRPLSMIRPKTAQDEPDLGEPGPPVSYSPTSSPPSISHPATTDLDLDPIQLAALYNINYLPEQGKGISAPTAVIYSDLKPLREKSTISRKRRNGGTSSSLSFSPSVSTAASGASSPLRKLRGIAQSLRRKTFSKTV
ncbi:hypothetical protein BJX99DRAFT_259371 [Aspergillus californicus]